MQEQPGAKGKRQAVLQQARRALHVERQDVLRGGGDRTRVRKRKEQGKGQEGRAKQDLDGRGEAIG